MHGSPSAIALAHNVRQLMLERGLSQETLAKLSGVSKSAIGYLLSYKDSSSRHAALDTIDALARAFHTTSTELLSAKASPAHTLQVAEPRPGAPELDVALLQLVLREANTLPGIDADGVAEVAAQVYAALAASGQKPTRAAVIRLRRTA